MERPDRADLSAGDRLRDLLSRQRAPHARFSAAVRTEYDGRLYDSKAEAEFARTLDLRVRAGELKRWERAVRYPLRVGGVVVGHYTPDFTLVHPDYSLEIVEIKGRVARDFPLRKRLFEALYPQLKLTLLRSDGRPWAPRRARRRK